MTDVGRRLVDAVPPGADLVLPPTCSTPVGLTAALADQSHRLAGSRVLSGLLLGPYPFLEPPHDEHLRYGTWHVARPIGHLADAGLIDVYPVRASDVPALVRRITNRPAVIAQVSLPDDDGWCSLGVSGSYVAAAVADAGTLVAHVNPQMPRVPGSARIRLAEAAVVVEYEQPLIEYARTVADEVSARIGERIEALVPDGATLQIGLGAVPEAVIDALCRSDRRDLAVWGMAADGIVDLDEAGVLHRDPTRPVVTTHDVLGTRRLFDWLDGNDQAVLHGYDVCASAATIGRIPRFLSINSAVEIDLQGNANAEVVAGRTVSGLGGGPDFTDGARTSPGGASILAMPSTARGGTVSRIVPKLGDVPRSHPRSRVQHVITEHGAVDLSSCSLSERAAALIAIAAPDFRDGLWAAHEDQMRTVR